MEGGMFKVFKLIAGQESTLLSGTVPSKAEAVVLAETEVAAFPTHGYNDEHGFFWVAMTATRSRCVSGSSAEWRQTAGLDPAPSSSRVRAWVMTLPAGTL
jgi:hypothetical protein